MVPNFIPGISIGAFISLAIAIYLSRKAIKRHQENSNFKSLVDLKGIKMEKQVFAFEEGDGKNKSLKMPKLPVYSPYLKGTKERNRIYKV